MIKQTIPIWEADVIYLPKKRPLFPLWKSRVTSPPGRLALPLGAPAEVYASFANVILSLTKLLDFVCRPDSVAKWKKAPQEQRRGGCAQLAGRLLFTQLVENSICPSTSQMEAPKAKFSLGTKPSMPNTVNRLVRQGDCGHFFIPRVGLSLRTRIKAGQCGFITRLCSHFKMGHRESPFVDPFS